MGHEGRSAGPLRWWAARWFHQLILLVLPVLGLAGCSPSAPRGLEDSASASNTVDASAQPAERELPNARIPFFHKPVCVPREPRADDWFEDVTARSGVDFTYRDGQEAGFYQLLENLGGGVAIFDYDRDGDMDLFLTGGGSLQGPPIELSGRPPALYRNDGKMQFTDVTAAAGVDYSGFYSHGCTVGDFDRDGWPDLFVAGYLGCRLYRNNQQGGFADVTAASGLRADRWCVTGAWADVDNDGWLDLYVITYCDWVPDHRRRCLNDQQTRDICAPSLFEGDRDYLWRNRGDGTFEDITDRAGLEPRSRALGVVAADLNEDGWMDFYVANDVQENHLYQGRGQLAFDSVALLAGVAYSDTGERQGSMGLDIGDFDGDGQVDLWYTNYSNQDNSLMRKVDEMGFVGVSNTTGMFGISRLWVGFGTGFADFDGDGWQDLFVANGHVAYDRLDSPYYQPAQLFRNQSGQRYVDVSLQGGPYFSVPHVGRGAAVGDLDNDGSLDLVISHQNDPVVLLRNRLPAEHWVRLLLRGVASNPDAVGARVTASYEGRQLTRWIRGGGGYQAYFDPRILFPATDSQPVDVTVKWPSGQTEVFGELTQGQTHELVEGMGRRP